MLLAEVKLVCFAFFPCRGADEDIPLDFAALRLDSSKFTYSQGGSPLRPWFLTNPSVNDAPETPFLPACLPATGLLLRLRLVALSMPLDAFMIGFVSIPIDRLCASTGQDPLPASNIPWI